MTEINIALIGYKFMGKAHSNAYRQVKHFFPGRLTPRMKVMCGRDRNSLEAAAAQFGWEEIETDWRKVMDRKDIEVVDISTPGNTHAQIAIAAAIAKKHIICEKPLANTLVDAMRMLDAVNKAGVKHMVMHNYRKIPAIALAKQLIENGKIGKVYHYHGAYLQDWIMDPTFPLVWRLDKKLAGSGALGDIGSHAIDFAHYLNSNFESVTAQMTTFIDSRPLPGAGAGAWGAKGAEGTGEVTVDDDTNFLARFTNGSVGVFETSRFCGGRRNHNTFQIYGSKGSLAFNLEKMNELEFFDGTEPEEGQGYKTILATRRLHPYIEAWWPPGHIIGYEHTFVHAVRDFLTALEKDNLPSPNFFDGVQNQAVLHAVEVSARTAGWERVRWDPMG
jgi:predicted dehydrogenase